MDIAAVSGGLSSLALLACPVGMGLMMWMMARGQKKSNPARGEQEEAASDSPASIELLREEHRRLGSEIERLEGDAGAGAVETAGKHT